jgi:hypothetical protein
MRNATYWTVVPGQIAALETIDAGCGTAHAAHQVLDALIAAGGTGRVVCLRTIEHDAPADDPAYAPFESSRYCVIVRAK